MDVVLAGRQRLVFRTALLAHRAQSTLTDADYVRTILRVSLNTFKKCIGDGASLTLKRRSFNAIVANAGLDARRFGAKEQAPAPPDDFGGYTRAEYGYMIGRYLLHRRSFQNGIDITRGVLDIGWDDSRACLSFNEMRRYKNANGSWQSNDMGGHIFMHPERVLMGLLAIDKGDVRLTLLHIPSRHAYGTNLGTIRTSGVLLTHGYPKRFFQPVVSAVTIEAVDASKRTASPNTLCAPVVRGSAEYAAIAEDLRIAEEHAIVLTPLMWRSAQGAVVP
jgi:hypothetical protein